MVKIHKVKLNDEQRTIDRKITKDKKESEVIIAELFKGVTGLEGDIIPIEDESSGQHDVNIVKADKSELSIEITEFVIQEHIQRESFCKLITNTIDSKLLDSKITPSRKSIIQFNFASSFKPKEINTDKIAEALIKFFSNPYEENKHQGLYKADKVSVSYLPTGFLSKNIHIDYAGDKLWDLQWNRNSYGDREINKQLQRIVKDNKKKENNVEILVVVIHNNNLHSYASGYLDNFKKELSVLKFKGIYILEVIEKTFVFAKKQGDGGEKSTLNGEDFNLIIYPIKTHESISKKLD